MRRACSIVIQALGLFTFCGFVLAALPAPASAGPVEQLVQVSIHPSDPDTMLAMSKPAE